MSNFYTDVIQQDQRFGSTVRISDPMLLEPVTRAAVQKLVSNAQSEGIALMIYETYRSQVRQQLLFDNGATKLRTVGVHHYGLACDIVRSVAGQPSWKGDFTFMVSLAQGCGLISGIDWGQPGVKHMFIDSVHVQRVTVAEQNALFAGTFYPDDAYNPYQVSA